jgi:hypothetical protein
LRGEGWAEGDSPGFGIKEDCYRSRDMAPLTSRGRVTNMNKAAEKFVVKIRKDVRIYIHNDLMNAADFLKGKIDERSKKGDRDGIGLEIMACLTIIAFAFEAQMNFLGFKLIPNWEERKPYLLKFERLAEKLSVNVDYESRPHSTVKELKEFRDTLAHGKPKEIKGESEEIITREELERRDLLKAEWQGSLTEEFLGRAYDDMEDIWRQFLKESGLSVIDTITSGERTVQVIETAEPSKAR